jgi:hypothetical protein
MKLLECYKQFIINFQKIFCGKYVFYIKYVEWVEIYGSFGRELLFVFCQKYIVALYGMFHMKSDMT